MAGAVGGAAYGCYLVAVSRPLVVRSESYEPGHVAAGFDLAALTSVAGGVLWGVLLGIAAFGVAFYLLEPALPDGVAGSLLVAAGGFLTVSGAPWLALPPQPPGTSYAVGTDVRTLVYGGLIVAGAAAAVASGWLHRRLRERGRGVALAGAALPLLALLPAVSFDPGATVLTPPELTAAVRASAVVGQVGLWLLLGVVHTHLRKEAVDDETPTAVVD